MIRFSYRYFAYCHWVCIFYCLDFWTIRMAIRFHCATWVQLACKPTNAWFLFLSNTPALSKRRRLSHRVCRRMRCVRWPERTNPQHPASSSSPGLVLARGFHRKMGSTSTVTRLEVMSFLESRNLLHVVKRDEGADGLHLESRVFQHWWCWMLGVQLRWTVSCA